MSIEPTVSGLQINAVLVTTDFSPLANRAMMFAARLVPVGGKIVVLTVQHPRSLSDSEYVNGPWQEENRQQHQVHLGHCRERLAALVRSVAASVQVETKLIESDKVAEAICEEARILQVDAICLSSHGYTGFRASLLGSVAQSVLAHSPCPVVLVRGEI